MQIGEFAVLCKTKISVLRHYDKEGLLRPDYIDRFTGYRYYSEEQAGAFFEIASLKSAGFTLSEIKEIISEKKSNEELLGLFDKKKSLLRETLAKLKDAKKMLLGEDMAKRIEAEDSVDGCVLKYSCHEPCDIDDACEALDRALAAKGYQRVSSFRTYTHDLCVQVMCDAVKLLDQVKRINETEPVEFCNDPQMIGKWQVVGEYAVFEDFFFKKGRYDQSSYRSLPVICFLPEGKEYWCYSWSAGKLIIKSGVGDRSINDYTVREYGGQRYMIVNLKSYNYRRGGRTTVLVLRQIDNVSYSAEELARRDDINIPIEPDNAVLGMWRSCGFVQNKKDFLPEKKSAYELFWQTLTLSENGEAVSTFSNGDVVDSRNMQEWTKGYILRKWTKSACAYEIWRISGREYLFVEWKSGDYIYGGMDTNYYVFEREV